MASERSGGVDGKRASIQRLAALARTRRGKMVAAIALLVVAAVGLGAFLWTSLTQLPDNVALRVGDDEVTIAELEERAQTMHAMYGVTPPPAGPELDTFNRAIARSIAVEKVVAIEAAERNIVVSDREAQDALNRYVTQFYGPGPQGRERLVKELAEFGTSETKMLAEFNRILAREKLYAQVTADVTVTNADVRRAFENRREQLATPELRQVRNIVVSTEGAANELIAQLNGGASFEELAKQHSMDVATRDSGGDLGLVARSQLEQGYADAVFSAPVNTVFGPVEGRHGFNIGKVVAVEPPSPAEFEKVKDSLRERLLAERAAAQWADFIAQRTEAIGVEYADVYRPADPIGAPPAPGTVPPPTAEPAPPALPNQPTR